ncbi:MAG: hypothetical protein HN368_09530, partial [Spirochaetales bacterium]|nr:hypothetical protein [Spirochaetales bacterium]
GFSHYLLACELVCQVTRGGIDWLKNPTAQRTSRFGERMEILDGVYPTFADCSRDVAPAQWLVHWMNNRIDPERKSRKTERRIDWMKDVMYPFSLMLSLPLFAQVDSDKAYSGSEKKAAREWFEDAQFLICRPAAESKIQIAATFIGGNNGVNHNHNDLGTYSVLINGVELLADPGKEVYTVRTFGPDRYDSGLLNSYGHPVPLVAGTLQCPGAESEASIVKANFSADVDSLELDLSRAYQVPTLKKLSRTFIYTRTGQQRIVIIDQVEFSELESFETALITYASWEQYSDGKLQISDGRGNELRSLDISVTMNDQNLRAVPETIDESSKPTRLGFPCGKVSTARVVTTIISGFGSER